MKLNICTITKLINCLCGEYTDLHYEKIDILSKKTCIAENRMSIKNVEQLDQYDIIDIKDL